MRELRDTVKSIPMDDVLDRLGIRLGRDRKIRSIYKEERTPSLHVYKYDYFDFATGTGGDQIRFVMDYNQVSFAKAVQWLARAGSLGDVRKRPKDGPVEERINDFTCMWESLPEVSDRVKAEAGWSLPLQDYVSQKWPSLLIDDIFAFGSKLVNGDIWTPHYWGGKVVGVKVRGLGGAKFALPGSTFRKALYEVHPKPKLYSDMVAAFIVEGESDTWVLQKLLPGHQVLGLPSGAGLWRDEWRSNILTRGKVFVIFDDDGAGRAAADRVGGSLRSVGFDVVVKFPPPWSGGRLAEAVAGGWIPQDTRTLVDIAYENEGVHGDDPR
jgi:hypothetical protein